MKDYYKRKDCRVCKSENVNLSVPLINTPIGDLYSKHINSKSNKIFDLDLYVCENCCHGQLLDVVKPELIYSDFIYETKISAGLSEHFESYCRQVVSKLKLSRSTFVIDIGSNDGTLLNYFKMNNLKTLGIEPAKEIATIANENGINTICSYYNREIVNKIIKQYDHPDVITSNNTIANIDNIIEFVENIKLLMHSQSVFIFETGYLLDIIRNGLFDTIYHEHLSYFTVNSLQHLFAKLGLELFDIQLIKTKGGSLRGFVQLPQGKYKVSNAVIKQIQLESNQNIDKHKFYETFNNNLKIKKIKLLNTINELKEQGNKLSGYGASVGVTTFLYYFDISSQIDYLFDDNISKYNLFSPGKNILVKDSKLIKDYKPDYIIIFAWRYTDIIISNNEEYLQDGGKFIIPWPNIKIIN